MRTALLFSVFWALPTVLSIPVQPEISNTTALPFHFGLLVFPNFQALDVFGPMDVLNTFSNRFKTPMRLSIISKTLDSVSTQKTPRINETQNDFGQKIVPTITITDALVAKKKDGTPDDIDVLIVPGGGGTRDAMHEEIDFVKTTYPKVKYIISVCTGATILSRAGILDGKKATTNKRSWTWAISTGPKVDWVHTARWVEDGNIWTSSGISAGIDVTYAWLGHVYGEEVADYVSMSSEYKRWTNSTDDPFADIWT